MFGHGGFVLHIGEGPTIGRPNVTPICEGNKRDGFVVIIVILIWTPIFRKP